jgi:general secretion pathway protein I
MDSERPFSGRPRRRSAGFTLVEVMVALAIFALSAIVLGSAYLNIINSYVAAGRGTGEDPDLMFSRQALLTQPDLTLAETGDEYDTAEVAAQPGIVAQSGHHVKWSSDIEPTTMPDLFTVTLTCVETTTALGVNPKTVTQTFMLLRPTWSQPPDRQTLMQNETTRIAQAQGKEAK